MMPAHAAETQQAPMGDVFTNYTPQLGGDATVGGLLKVEHSPMLTFGPGSESPSYSYSWARDGVTIPGATGPSYRALQSDLGHVIAASVTITYDPESKVTIAAQSPLRIAAAARTRGFDGDDAMDLFARDAAGRLLLYPTDGHGHWKPARVIGTGWNIFNYVLSPGDFDGDGAIDVLARDHQGRLFLYPGNGSGGWKPASQVGQGWQLFNELMAAGDFNGDATNDVLARDAAGRLFLYPGNGRGGWLPARQVGQGWNGLDSVGAGHFLGSSDLVVLSRSSAGDLQVRTTNRNGWFDQHGTSAGLAGIIGWGWQSVSRFGAAGDFNGDGYADIYGIDPDGRLTMYLGDTYFFWWYGLSGFRWQPSAVVGWGWGGFTAVF
ncbi:FG-GAP-like repeat-containing protein [Paenarthrobacter sp. NPDC089714]|uniref:FG-GAP repeat domain-containing protein n=1 Tax=Paenarthrobacter sp. NPDC089714 TaxID=3364377 RepID=UPI0038163830